MPRKVSGTKPAPNEGTVVLVLKTAKIFSISYVSVSLNIGLYNSHFIVINTVQDYNICSCFRERKQKVPQEGSLNIVQNGYCEAINGSRQT